MHGDRFGNCDVKTAVQRLELLNSDRRALLNGELGDRLANVAVVVYYLRDIEAGRQELLAVPRGGGADRARVKWRGSGRYPQRFRQLRQESRHAVLEFVCGHKRPRTRAHPFFRTRNDHIPIEADELAQHHVSSARRTALRLLSHDCSAFLQNFCAHRAHGGNQEPRRSTIFSQGSTAVLPIHCRE